MQAPEKIYVEIRHPFGNEFTEMLGFEHRGNSNDIEYIRTDAFIEKACEFLKDRIEHDSIDYPMATKHLIEDFKIYMKGE